MYCYPIHAMNRQNSVRKSAFLSTKCCKAREQSQVNGTALHKLYYSLFLSAKHIAAQYIQVMQSQRI